MTIEEKIENFHNASLESAREKAAQLISDHQAALDKIYKEHETTALRQAEAERAAETQRLKRERNKQLSTEQLHLKRSVSKANTALKEKLFAEVSEKLGAFMKTPEYTAYLADKIGQAKAFADPDPIVIYINPSDAHLKEELEARTRLSLTISKEDFVGGCRAVIASRHILIDNSFASLKAEAHAAFDFHGGYKH